jgi:hypothetical protein
MGFNIRPPAANGDRTVASSIQVQCGKLREAFRKETNPSNELLVQVNSGGPEKHMYRTKLHVCSIIHCQAIQASTVKPLSTYLVLANPSCKRRRAIPHTSTHIRKVLMPCPMPMPMPMPMP